MRHQNVSFFFFGGALFVVLVWRWVYVEWTLFRTNVDLTTAFDQIQTFYLLRDEAKDKNTQGKAAILSEIEAYFPSGSAQTAGSPLDRIVEKVREETVRSIFSEMALPRPNPN
jgi:hypothetical protein